MSELQQIVVGLAGHIDHGKSALIGRLTGAATDRRPEEQRRGMTVDLGFTHFDAANVRVALIDVPGHERFVHNMLSGAAAVQFALLVIAADDSVMPQTREHLDIISLLGIDGGIIAITKTDLVDAEQLELVQLEIEELVDGTSFAGAPVIPVSSATGAGLDTLRESLVRLAGRSAPVGDLERTFRLSIDRAFTLTGHGTIVTGTVRHGTVRAGDSLFLLPQQERVKIRQLQAHGEDTEMIHAGQRAALNVAGVKSADVRRGDELVGHAAYQPTRRFLASLDVLPNARRGIRHREPVRLHVGTREVTARVLIFDKEAAPGDRTTAVVVCQSPVVGEFGQPIIVRRLSPATTLGGGRILSPHIPRRRSLRRLLELGSRLNSDDPVVRLRAYLDLQGPIPYDEELWRVAIGGTPDQNRTTLRDCVDHGVVIATATDPPKYITAQEWNQLASSLTRQCADEIQRRAPQRLISRSILTHRFEQSAGTDVIDCVIDELIRTGTLIGRGDRIGLSEQNNLSPPQQALLESLAAEISEGGTTPLSLKELASQHNAPLKDVEQLVQVLIDEGRLIRVSPELAITPKAWETLRSSLAQFFSEQPTGTAAEIRDLWGVTRKYVIPYLEYFDRLEITRRSDPVRTAGPRLHEIAVEDLIS